MSSNDSSSKKPRRPIKTDRGPKKAAEPQVKPEVQMVRETDLRAFGLPDANAREFDAKRQERFEQSRGFPKLTPDQVMAILRQRDEMGKLEGEGEFEVGLVGYVTQEDLNLLSKGEGEAFPAGDSFVNLWHADNPPSRAVIPLFTMPEGFSIVDEEPKTYQGYADPDDIQAGSEDDEDEDEFNRSPAPKSFSEQIEEYEQTIQRLETQINNEREAVAEVEAENTKLRLAADMLNVSWFTRLKVKLQNRWAPKAVLTVEEARIQPFYLVNSLSASPYELEGDLILQFKGPRNKDEMLKLPHTWLPMPTTDFHRQWMLNDREFLNAVEAGLVRITSEGFARKLRESEKGVEEIARLEELDQLGRNLYGGRPFRAEIYRADGFDEDDEDEDD